MSGYRNITHDFILIYIYIYIYIYILARGIISYAFIMRITCSHALFAVRCKDMVRVFGILTPPLC